jgi:23S rRNA (uracil1939-C5)-methyltransferase
VLGPPTTDDVALLDAFARDTGLSIYLQPGGADSIQTLDGVPVSDGLRYSAPLADANINFGIADFIQVNPGVNKQMVSQAIDLLALTPDARVLDLYCGLGNFSLAMARRAALVTGVEGSEAMVDRASANAERAELTNLRFRAADLSEAGALDALAGDAYDRVLLDPPRSGAAEVLDAVASFRPGRIVYVSCHPGTLARDVRRLCGDHGYRLEAAGAMDMFPQTAHVEAMALLIADDG